MVKIGLDPDNDRIYFAEADKRYYGFRIKYSMGCAMIETSSRIFEYYKQFSGNYMANVDLENGLIYIDLTKMKGIR